MRGKKFHIAIIAIFVIIIGVCFYYIYPFESSINLGLDLKGGTQITLKPTELGGEEVTPESLDKATLIIMNRIDKLGISEPLVTRDTNTNNIIVQLPGVKDPSRALEVIGKTAQLEFRILEGEFGVIEDNFIKPVVIDSETIKSLSQQKDKTVFLFESLWTGKIKDRISVDEKTGDIILEDYESGKLIGKIMPPTSDGELFLVDPETKEKVGEILLNSKTESSVLVGPVLLTGDRLVNAQAGYDSTGKIIVSMSFTSEGKKIFEKVTSENIGRQLAIVLDKDIKSAPVIRTAISGDAVIEGIDSLDEAKDIALVLQTGALPVNLVVEENTTVGPTLGKDSLTKGLYAGMIGFFLIVVFMLSYYRGLGLVSIMGLLIYIVILWGVLSGIGATLTLPGIAGVILTIGMAVDANVIVFERIKEEIRKGKSLRVAVSEGFKHGMRTVIDSNITTLITAAALYRFGTGPVKGFAVTLSLGVIISMITTLIFSRSVLSLMAGLRRVSTPGFLGAKEEVR